MAARLKNGNMNEAATHEEDQADLEQDGLHEVEVGYEDDESSLIDDLGLDQEHDLDESQEPDEADESDEDEEPEEDPESKEDDEPEQARLAKLEKAVESQQKRIDRLTAEREKWRKRAEGYGKEVSEVKRSTKPDAPWEADERYIELSTEYEQLERQTAIAEQLLDKFIDDPDEARESLSDELAKTLSKDDRQARQQLREWLRDSSKKLRAVERERGIIEDRGRTVQERRIQSMNQVVQSHLSFVDDEESPIHPIVQELESDVLGHLKALPEYKFLLGSVAYTINALKSSGQKPATQKVAAAVAGGNSLKPVNRTGKVPKVGKGVGGAPKPSSDDLGAALAKIDPHDVDGLAAFLGSRHDT